MKPEKARIFLRKTMEAGIAGIEKIDDEDAVLLAITCSKFLDAHAPAMMSGKQLSAYIVHAAFEQFGVRMADQLSPGYKA